MASPSARIKHYSVNIAGVCEMALRRNNNIVAFIIIGTFFAACASARRPNQALRACSARRRRVIFSAGSGEKVSSSSFSNNRGAKCRISLPCGISSWLMHVSGEARSTRRRHRYYRDLLPSASATGSPSSYPFLRKCVRAACVICRSAAGGGGRGIWRSAAKCGRSRRRHAPRNG